MSCPHWNDSWVGALYDDLPDGDRPAMEIHLADCETCADSWRQLSDARVLLRDGAPDVPDAPRLVIQSPTGLSRPLWSFVAGAATAAAVFALGLVIGMQRTPPQILDPELVAAAAAPQTEALLARIELLEDRVSQTEIPSEVSTEVSTERPAVQQTADWLTRDEFEARLDRIGQSLEVARARDMEFVVGEIRATEWRFGNWADETRDALRLVALQADGRLSQH